MIKYYKSLFKPKNTNFDENLKNDGMKVRTLDNSKYECYSTTRPKTLIGNICPPLIIYIN